MHAINTKYKAYLVHLAYLATLTLPLNLLACASNTLPVHSQPATAVPAGSTVSRVQLPPTSASPPPATRVAPPPSAREHLKELVDSYIGQPRFEHASWGIDVLDLDTGTTLYTHRANKLFIPASNVKLYTAALALHTLGPRYRFRTTLYASRRANTHGVLHGDLVLYGRGDPSLGAGSNRQPPTAWADQLVSVLAARGVHRIRGNLVADDTDYAGPPFGAGWEAGDLLNRFAPAISALSAQGNTFTLRIGGDGDCCSASIKPIAAGVSIINTLHRSTPGAYDPLGLYRAAGSNRLYVFGSHLPTTTPRIFNLAVPDPARMAGGLLADALARHGIGFDGHILTRHWPQENRLENGKGWIRITDVRSAPLGQLIGHMLKHSDNLYAQLLLMAAGKHQSALGSCHGQRHPPNLTTDWGLCAMRGLMRHVGITTGSTQIEEGSGLSRKNRVTPAASVALLSWLDHQSYAALFRQALPLAGVNGTLRSRFRDTPAAGNLRAKTGTLRYAYALSGYVRAVNGHRLAFSIMLNDYARPIDHVGKPGAPRATGDIDAIARFVTAFGSVPLPASENATTSTN